MCTVGQRTNSQAWHWRFPQIFSWAGQLLSLDLTRHLGSHSPLLPSLQYLLFPSSPSKWELTWLPPLLTLCSNHETLNQCPETSAQCAGSHWGIRQRRVLASLLQEPFL